jgi:excisionase family DNA binding protein
MGAVKFIVPDGEHLWTPYELAAKLRVAPKTVSRWAKDGRIDSLTTPGGHHRFRDHVVQDLLKNGAPYVFGSGAGETRPAGSDAKPASSASL